MNATTTTKARPIFVFVSYSESEAFNGSKLFTVEEFETLVLQIVAQRVAEGKEGGYYKTDITIGFEDGDRYACRFDIGARDPRTIAARLRRTYEGALSTPNLIGHGSLIEALKNKDLTDRAA